MIQSRDRGSIKTIKSFHFVPAVVLALSLMAGSIAGEYADGRTGKWLPVSLPVMGILAFVYPTPIGLFGSGFAAGVAIGDLRRLVRSNEPEITGEELTLRGMVENSSPGIHGNTELMVNVTEILSRRREHVRFCLRLNIKGRDLPAPGSPIKARAVLKRVYRDRKHGIVVWGKALGDGLFLYPGSFIPLSEPRSRLELAFDRKNDAAAGLLAAVSLGQRWRVDRSLRNTMRRTGTYHLMAISGVHLASALVLPLLFIRVLLVGVATDEVGWKKLLPLVGGLLTISIYLSLTGLSTSALRAGIFVLFAWVAIIAGRYPHPFSVLGWCVTFIICMGRSSQPDLALLLSISAVAGILVAGVHPSRLAGKALRVTMGAILFTLPLSVWCSGGISLLAPVCNLMAGLVFGLILIPFAVLIDLLACLATSAWEPLISVWILIAKPVLAVLDRFSDLPFAFLLLSQAGNIVATIAAITAIVIWKNRDFELRAGIILFLAVAVTAGTFEWTHDVLSKGKSVMCFPRVGQADAAILRGDGHTIIIDCAGPVSPGRTTPLERSLVRMGVTKIDALFLTHAHPDHIGGFKDLVERWRIDALYLPEIEGNPGRWSGVLESLQRRTEMIPLTEGDAIRIGSFDVLVLGPPAGWGREKGENARSLQLCVKGEDITALFTGDALWSQVLLSLEKMKRLDLIKIPHHGSKTGFPPPGLASSISRLRGKGGVTAVFPSPPPGNGALPSREVVEWFERQGVRCLFTGERAGVFIKPGKKYRSHGF